MDFNFKFSLDTVTVISLFHKVILRSSLTIFKRVSSGTILHLVFR